MSDRGVLVLGAVALAASTLLFSLWTVQMMVVPVVVFLVLFALLLRGPITSERRAVETTASRERPHQRRAA
jgi:membrane protein implicated in regulation of membrane protease activity